MQQKTFNFDSPPPQKESGQVATETSLPPPPPLTAKEVWAYLSDHKGTEFTLTELRAHFDRTNVDPDDPLANEVNQALAELRDSGVIHVDEPPRGEPRFSVLKLPETRYAGNLLCYPASLSGPEYAHLVERRGLTNQAVAERLGKDFGAADVEDAKTHGLTGRALVYQWVEALLAPPFVRPDRQVTYPDAGTHYNWPKATELHDHDTITVDRVVDDIDGPAHRFIIKRGDTVEAYMGPNRMHVGEVIGVSHARQEVRVAWDSSLKKGGWFKVGAIYPAPEPAPSQAPNHKPLSTDVAKCNAEIAPPGGWDEAGRVSDLAPYTFAEFKELWKTRGAGQTFPQYKETFERLVVSEEAIKAELLSTYSAPKLKTIATNLGDWNAKGSTKAKNAQSIYRKMLSFFLLDGSVSFGVGESYTEAVKTKVRAVTQESWKAHHEAVAKRRDEHAAAITDPQNLADFAKFIRHKGEPALSNEQMARWDVLHADLARQRQTENGPAKTVTQFESEELGEIEFATKEGYHDKKECPLWIVQLSTRVDRPAFNELKTKARMLGGWYSSFKKSDAGFQFLDEVAAEKFTALLDGDADREDILAARKLRKELSASERLHELAETLAQRAEEAIERSNESLQNTARRADIQAGVRGRSFADQALARTMHSVAEALSTGRAKYLDGVRHKTHVETLDTVLYLARWARIREIRKAKSETEYGYGLRVHEEEEKPYSEDDIRFAEYPYPSVYKRHLKQAVLRCRTLKGAKMISERMRKRIAREKDDCVDFTTEHDITQLADFLARVRSVGYETELIDQCLERYKRLQAANLTEIHLLRAALREYLPHKASVRGDDPVRVAERELIGKDLPGFFPTPRPVIEEMLSHAAILAHHRILEPSCGKGDIVEAIAKQVPGAEIAAIEQNRTLADVLSAKGIAVDFYDFLEHQETYDRIVMNPPFEKGQDIEHVRHAYACLAPGGTLVSVMSGGPFFRSDTRAAEFRSWLDELGGESFELAPDAFSTADAFRQTGVRTRIVVIHKEEV